MSKKLQLSRIENLLQRLDAAVVVRDPGSARAAEMYEGLRRQIIQSGKNHRTHLSHLLALQDSIDRGADIDLVRERINEYLKELGIAKSSNVSNIDSFEVVEGEGSAYECIEPAIIEVLEDGTIRTHQLGKARRIPGSIVSDDTDLQSISISEAVQISNPRESNSQSKVLRSLIAVVLLLLGIQLGRTLFDSSDAPKEVVTTTTLPNTEITTTTTD
jgi:hypothetical protein